MININLLIIFVQGVMLFILRFLRIISEDKYYTRIAEMIKSNGVVFVKLAQISSSRNDNGGLPEPLTVKLRNIQDKCFYYLSGTVRQLPGLTYLNANPISAGSICNIYLVTYRGRPAVLKSAHENIQTYIDDSIKTLRQVNFLYRLYSGHDIENNINLTGYREYICQQLDLSREASYQGRMRDIFRPHRQIRIPEVYLSGADYIVMEQIEGLKYNDFIALYPERTMECISLIYSVVYTMIRSGCIHGDLHFGNFSYYTGPTGNVHMNILDYGIMMEVTKVQLAYLQGGFNIMEDDKTCSRSFLNFVSTFDPLLKARLSKIDLNKGDYTYDELMGIMNNVAIPLPFVAFFTTIQSFYTLIRGKSNAELTDIICYMIENDFLEF